MAAREFVVDLQTERVSAARLILMYHWQIGREGQQGDKVEELKVKVKCC